MTTREQASGAGFTEDGVEFHPLTLLSYDKLVVWMQDGARKEVLAEAREEGLRGELLRAYVDTGLQQARQLSAGTQEGIRLLSSYAGQLKLLDISSRGKLNLNKLKLAKGEDLEDPSIEFIKYIDGLVDRIYELTKQPEEDAAKNENKDEAAPDPTTEAQ